MAAAFLRSALSLAAAAFSRGDCFAAGLAFAAARGVFSFFTEDAGAFAAVDFAVLAALAFGFEAAVAFVAVLGAVAGFAFVEGRAFADGLVFADGVLATDADFAALRPFGSGLRNALLGS